MAETRIALLITSGNGPEECCLAVAGVLRRLSREAEQEAISLDVSTAPAQHGLKSAVIVLHGPGAEDFAARWCGTVCWRAKSPLRSRHKRANWFIGIFRLPQPERAGHALRLQDVVFESFRAGGPGGQHQNTTDSAVRATHRPTGLAAAARGMRSQHRNKALALERLQALIDARTAAAAKARKADRHKLHQAIARGDPVRLFKGPAFAEEGRP
ncbi:MAG: peptide chain release factor H [Leisingera sp.]